MFVMLKKSADKKRTNSALDDNLVLNLFVASKCSKQLHDIHDTLVEVECNVTVMAALFHLVQ